MAKTAMGQLIVGLNGMMATSHSKEIFEWTKSIRGLAQSLLETEKQQIIDACTEFGNFNGVDIEDYESYFTQTYQSEGI